MSDSFRVYKGDCIDVMKLLPDASIDAIITDPPYGISFMGKAWDGAAIKKAAERDQATRRDLGPHGASRPGRKEPRSGSAFGNAAGQAGSYDFSPTGNFAFQVWCQAWAAEALRVLKPGGHLLAFGGTRTYHRLAAGIEDAGFEVRDCIAWMYGSGFPKSMNVGMAIDKAARGAPQGGPDPESPHHGQYRTQKTEGKRDEADKGQGYGAGGSRFLRVGDIDPATGRRIIGRRTDGRYAHGFSEQAKKALGGVVASENESGFTGDMGLITEPATPEAAEWEGWGTALKPAFEPIIVARKPLAGTVVANVLEHGTGALNIDGCRIGFQSQADERESKDKNRHGDFDSKPRNDGSSGIYSADLRTGAEVGNYDPPGRWPANVALGHTDRCVPLGTRDVKGITGTAGQGAYSSGIVYGEGKGQERGEPVGVNVNPDGTETVEAWNCSEDCPIRLLDEQTGERPGMKSAQLRRGSTTGGSMGNGNTMGRGQELYDAGVVGYDDTGGASRFFYCAKADRGERNAGLSDFDAKALHWSSGDQNPGSFQSEGTDKTAKNPHPTVKPIDLMRWLVRLVTPPGGTVLDPFLGSGTTGCAAVLEGFRFVGVEAEDEYVDIAKARIRFWSQQPAGITVEKAVEGERRRQAVAESGQGGLF